MQSSPARSWPSQTSSPATAPSPQTAPPVELPDDASVVVVPVVPVEEVSSPVVSPVLDEPSLELPELSISAQCCRVAVAVGHSMNVWFTLGERASLAELEQVLGESARTQLLRLFPGSAGDGLSALACVADRDRALVGRLRVDPRDPSGRSFCAMIVGDNLRLGAATNAVRVASRWFASQDPALQDPAGPATA